MKLTEKETDLIIDGSNKLLEFILSDTALENVKLIPWAKDILNIADAIDHRLTTSKVKSILNQVKTDQLDQNIIDKIENNPKKKNKFLAQFILIAEKVNDVDKPAILGNLMTAFLQGKISEYEFFSSCFVINQLLISDLRWLVVNKNNYMTVLSVENMRLCGIGVLIQNFNNDSLSLVGLTELGAVIVEHGVKNVFEKDGELLLWN